MARVQVNSSLLRFAFALSAVSLLVGCENSQDLQVLVRQPPYPRLRCAKGPASLGQLHPGGQPIAKATVIVKPAGLRARSSDDGKATIKDLIHGRHQLVVTAPGFSPLVARSINTPSYPIDVHLQPCISGRDRLQVGFNRTLTLHTRNFCGGDWKAATYRWRQLEGPDISASVAAWDKPRLRFTTAPLEQARGFIPALPQVLSFSHDQAGEYVFEVVATSKAGVRSVDYVLVTSTAVVTGLTSVAPFYRYYFVGPAGGPWEWKVLQAPKNWRVNLEGHKTRTPSVLPTPQSRTSLNEQQNVVIRDNHSGTTFSLVFGAWNVVRRDCGRPECHASMESHWKATTHARSWQRLIDGELDLERGVAESCADCHSLGYDRRVANGGYDDIADELKFFFPQTIEKGNYAAMPEPVREVSNVYCVACHGPARVDPPIAEPPGLYQVGVCARCHDRLPEQAIVAQWRLSSHAKEITDKLNGPAQRPECARCHTAQGFYYHNVKMSRPPSSRTAVLTCCETPAPIGCQACHNGMVGANKAQLHFFGSARTASGLKLAKLGSSAGCVLCHNAWNDRQNIDERGAPHAPQTDLLYGKAGYELPAGEQQQQLPKLDGVACASKTEQGCVTCHMFPLDPKTSKKLRLLGGHTFRLSRKRRPSTGDEQHLAACRGCHEKLGSLDPRAKADYDGDGAIGSASTEIEGLRRLLRQKLQQRIAARGYRSCNKRRSVGASYSLGYREKVVVVDGKGRDLGDCDGNGAIERDELPFTFPDEDILLHKAAYNDLLIEADGSGGRHNYGYAVKLLQRTISALGDDVPRWTLRR